MADSIYAPEGGVDNFATEPRRKQPRYGRAICQFLLVLDIAAAVGFIVAGLAGCSWINFYVQNDSSMQAYDLITSYANFSRIQGLFYTCVYSNAWNTVANPNNQSFFGVAFGAPPNTIAGSNPGSPAFWQIVNLRWWQVVLHMIAGGIACIVVLVNLFTLIPSIRRSCHHTEENMSYFGAIAMAISATLQLICMILFHIRYAAENATDTRASVWMDIWGNIPTSVQSQTVMTYSVDYALGWCAFACLCYATIIFLARDHTCNVLGEPVLDPYLGGTSDDYTGLEGKKVDEAPMDEVFGPPAAGLYGNPALVGQTYGPTYGTYGPAGGAGISPYYGTTSIGMKPAQQYQFGQVGGGQMRGPSAAGTSRTLPFQLGRPAGGNVDVYSTNAQPMGGQVNPVFQAGVGAGPSGVGLSGSAGLY